MQATSQSCQPAVAVELFCGVGGFSFGIEQVGFDVGLALQKDETTCQSYPKDFPHLSALRADIVKLTGSRTLSDAIAFSEIAKLPSSEMPCPFYLHKQWKKLLWKLLRRI